MRKLWLSAASAIVLTLYSHGAEAAQSGPGTTITFQGSTTLESLTDQCSPYFGVGQEYNIIYRYKFASTDPNDALSIITDRSAFRIISADPSGSLNGNVSTNDTNTDRHAGLEQYASSSNLSIASAGGTNPISSAVNLKVLGTINDFFSVSGCTATLHSLLVLTPN